MLSRQARCQPVFETRCNPLKVLLVHSNARDWAASISHTSFGAIRKCYRNRHATVACSASATAISGSGDSASAAALPARSWPKPTASDVFGGLTTAVVALPLALAFGVASGLGPLAGLYGSIFVGFFAAIFGGTPSQISGPTAPMTVVTASIVSKYAAGNLSFVFSVIVLAGVLQVILGYLKCGRYIRLVPRPVTSGFMTGIGVIIISTQWLALIGHTPASTTLAAIQQAGAALSNINQQAVLAGGVSLLLSVLTPSAITRFVPGSLLGLLGGTLAAAWGNFNVPKLGVVPAGLPVPQWPSFPPAMLPSMLGSAVVLSVLGAIDSLLTSLVADSLTGDYHDSDKELVGQGIGNALSGIFGGVAGAGATVRTVVNIRAGGRSPVSGALHSLVILAIVAGFGRFAQHIPLACLGGLLMKCGWDVLDFPYLQRLPQLPVASIFVMGVVLGLTVFLDLITAVAAGCSLMALLYVKDTADVQLNNCSLLTSASSAAAPEFRQLSPREADLLLASKGRIGMFSLEGQFAFGASQGLLRKVVPSLEAFDATILDLTEVDTVDDTAALAIEEMLAKAAASGHSFYICGATAAVSDMFSRLHMAPEAGMNRLEALEAATAAVASSVDSD